MLALSDKEVEYLTVAETARRMGKTQQYVYKLIKDKKLRPYRNINDKTVLRWDEVVEALEPKPMDETDKP